MSEVGTRPVPLGLTERDVDDAIERLTAQLGADKVITDPTEFVSSAIRSRSRRRMTTRRRRS